jgi:hypothetical protein
MEESLGRPMPRWEDNIKMYLEMIVSQVGDFPPHRIGTTDIQLRMR